MTGQIDAGRNRTLAHDAIVTAMTQLNRWGPDADIFGDIPDWKAARAAVTTLMERYARSASRPDATRRSPASTRRNPSSSRTSTPSSCAFASFEPALSPATT